MAYSGRCACGQVTLAISGEPIGTRQCWCQQCRRIAAGGPTNNAIFRSESVAIAGALGAASWTAASGNRLVFHFCPECGTQVFAQSSARMHLRTVRLGMLNEPHGLRPEMAIWTEDAPDWAVIDPDLEQWPQQPPAPVMPPAL
ncbi:GFA family protein [Novosphingobium flavum]|uniref:GFA family protein n=1 Tax=Novosphingobium flavum TaxID=1778672 RepID=A0A7X1FPZ5_9SPHN|nr:GFA family protein [Novosphingobium flavum]MBC2664719.1 GFA family protein [Novosphingobium flavum]